MKYWGCAKKVRVEKQLIRASLITEAGALFAQVEDYFPKVTQLAPLELLNVQSCAGNSEAWQRKDKSKTLNMPSSIQLALEEPVLSPCTTNINQN